MSPPYKILIAGAGLAGATLAVLLERAEIDYEVFESSSSISTFGSAILIGTTVMPVFEQLGLLDRLEEIAKPVKTMHLVEENLVRIGEINLADHKEQTGYNSLVTTRTEILNLLVSQIPSHKIHFSKRIVSFNANKDEVVIRCADDTTYSGDILIGADGAFSKIRELLYKQVAKKGILPRQDAIAVAADHATASVAAAFVAAANGMGDEVTVTPEAEAEALKGGHLHLVGVTNVLDVEKFPALLEKDSRSETVVGSASPYSWSCFAVPGDRICWAVNMEIDDDTLQEQRSRNASPSSPSTPPSPTSSYIPRLSSSSSDSLISASGILGWESEESNALTNSLLDAEECRSFHLPMGCTIGDLIDATPSHQMARAITEETLFETWHHGRTLLIGDACHRMFPNAAHQGGTNSIQDAIVLANLCHDLPSSSAENIVELFKDFQADRYPHVKKQMLLNRKVDHMLSGQTWAESLMRKFYVRYMSKVYQHFNDSRVLADRPQVTFLSPVEDRGHIHALPQKNPKLIGDGTHDKH
ncbi:hypothetical protein FBU30_005024 [Linnemannia zychae]|nr:hypothetical protein FBU30_005024 [Linnemannia zychae]